jgi:hypothetical protein
MPASMISAEVGSPIWKVIGRSMAIVAVGPMPGRTPISVPSSTPMKQKPRFWSVEAVAKPSERLSNRSMVGSSGLAKPRAEQPERQAEPIDEDGGRESSHQHGDQERGGHAHLRRGEGGEECGEEDRRHEAEPAHA